MISVRQILLTEGTRAAWGIMRFGRGLGQALERVEGARAGELLTPVMWSRVLSWARRIEARGEALEAFVERVGARWRIDPLDWLQPLAG